MIHRTSRPILLFTVLILASAAVAAYLAQEVAALGQSRDPFGDWPLVYLVVPMSFLFMVTHPLMTMNPVLLGAIFTVILFCLALIVSRPLRRHRYRFFDPASLWFFGIGIPTFAIADSVVVIPHPFFNLLAAFGIAVAGAVIVYFVARAILRRRRAAGHPST